MRTMRSLSLVLAVSAVLATSAFAQPPGRGAGGPGPGMGMGMGMGGGAGLLMVPAVQKELNLNDDQTAKVREIAQGQMAKMRDQMQELQDLAPGPERREKMEAFRTRAAEEVNKALAEALKPEQVKRFKQIELQSRGLQAFSDPKVQGELDLNADQKARLRELMTDLQGQMRTVMEQGQDDRAAALRKGMELRKQAMEKAVATLTDEQKKAWADLTGKPVEIGPPGPGGPGRGRRPQ